MVFYRAGDEVIAVATVHAAAIEFLDSFLDRAADGDRNRQPLAGITMTPDVLAAPDRVHGSVAICRQGRDYRIGRRSEHTCLDWGEALGVLRKVVRGVWLARQAPTGDYFHLHASAVDNGREVVIFTGDKRGGKTTLMLDAVSRHGFSLLTNDGLLIGRGAGGLVMSPLPTLVKIRGDVAERFLPFLAGRATDPYNAALLRGWRDGELPRVEDNALFLTFGALGRRFQSIPLRSRRVFVAGVQFGQLDGRPRRSRPLPPAEATDLLLRNRKELRPTFGDLTDFVPSTSERERDLVADLTEVVTVVRFTHSGECGPVLVRSA